MYIILSPPPDCDVISLHTFFHEKEFINNVYGTCRKDIKNGEEKKGTRFPLRSIS